MANVFEIIGRLGLERDAFESSLTEAEKSLKETGRKLQNIGGDLTRNVTMPLLAAGAGAVYVAQQFETQFATIQNLVGITGDDLEELRKGVLSLSGETAKSPKELADALFVVTSAGFRGKEALDVLEASAKASAIGLGETETVSRTVAAAVTAWASSGLEAARATDVLAGTVRAGNLEASTLAPALGKVMGLASAMGVSFEEVGASVAVYTRLGVDAAMATNDLAAILRGFLQPSSDAEEAAAGMGVSFETLRATIKEKGLKAALDEVMAATGGNTVALTSMFGSAEAVRAILGTVGTQGEAYTAVLDDMYKSTGLVNDGFNEVSGTSAFKFQSAMAALQAIGIAIGEALLPTLTWLAEKVTAVATWFGDLDGKTQAAIITIGIAVAAIGPLVTAVGALTAALAGAGAIMAIISSPVTIVVAAIVATVAAVAAVVIYWDEIVYGMKYTWLSFKGAFLEAAALILVGVEGFINGALELIRPMASFIGVDIPANVSVGAAAMATAALNTKGELAALEASHRTAKEEAAAMRDKIAAEIPKPPVAPVVEGLGEITGGADAAKGALTNLDTKITTDVIPNFGKMATASMESLVPPSDATVVAFKSQIDAVEIHGSELFETALPDMSASSLKPPSELSMTGIKGAYDEILKAGTDVFVGEDGLLHYSTEFAVESERVIREGLVDYMKTDFVAGFGEALGQQGLGGALSRTAELFAGGGQDSVKSAIGSVIGKMVGVDDTSIQGAMGSAFASLVRGDQTQAVSTLISAIPGVGTAFTAVGNVLAVFGVDINNIIAGIGEGIKGLLGLGGQQRGDVLTGIEATARQLLAAGSTASAAVQTLSYQWQEAMSKFDISEDELRTLVSRVFGLGSWGAGGGFGGADPFLMDELLGLARDYGMGVQEGQQVLDAIYADFMFGLGNLDRIANAYNMSREDADNLLRQILGLDRTENWEQFRDTFLGLFDASLSALLDQDRSISPTAAVAQVLQEFMSGPWGQSLLSTTLEKIGLREFRALMEDLARQTGAKDVEGDMALTQLVDALVAAAGLIPFTYTPPAAVDSAEYVTTWIAQVQAGTMDVAAAFMALMNAMNDFQRGGTGFMLTDEEEAANLSRFLAAFPGYSVFGGGAAGDPAMRAGGSPDINVTLTLDGQILAQELVRYIPDAAPV